MKDKISQWYKQGLWNDAMVLAAATKGVITEDDATGIIGGGRG